jgi:hypothetical protein
MKEVLGFLSKRCASHTVKYCKFGVVEEKSVSVLVQNRTPAWKIIALAPRGELPLLNKFKYLFAKWDLDRTIESHSVFFTRSHRDQFRVGTDLLPNAATNFLTSPPSARTPALSTTSDDI